MEVRNKHYVELESLRNELYDNDAITMKGIIIINNFPTVEMRPNIKAHKISRNQPIPAKWIDGVNKNGQFTEVLLKSVDNNIVDYCGECGKMLDMNFQKFCPFCGAEIID